MIRDSRPRVLGTSRIPTARRRWITAVVTVLSALAALLAVTPAATPAHAEDSDPPSEFATYNMQGSDRGTRWTTDVAPRAGRGVLLALQEVGPGPPPPAEGEDVQRIDVGGRPHEQPDIVTRTPWQTDGGIRQVYFLQTDPQRNGETDVDRWRGGRVNLALVTDAVADEVYVLENPVYDPDGPNNAYRSRPLLGLRFGDTWYWDTHARGGDVPGLLEEVRAHARAHPEAPNWVVLGDFNVNILNRDNTQARQSLHLESGERLLRTNRPTHITGNRPSELDYAIAYGMPSDLRATVPSGTGADHVLVRIARAGAPAPPSGPSPGHDLTVTALRRNNRGIQRNVNGSWRVGDRSARLRTRVLRSGAQILAALGSGSQGTRSARRAGEICASLGPDAQPDQTSLIVDGPCDSPRAQWTLTDAIDDVDVGRNEISEGAQRWRNVAIPYLCMGRYAEQVIAETCTDDPHQHWRDNPAGPSGDWPTAATDVRLESALFHGSRVARTTGSPGSEVRPAPAPSEGSPPGSDRFRSGWNVERLTPGDNLVRFKSPYGTQVCLGVHDVSAGVRTAAELRRCDEDRGVGGAGQRWLGERFADGTVRYRNEATNLCLQHHTEKNRPVGLAACANDENQSFKLVDPESEPGPKAPHIRLMPLGDSITEGLESSDGNGYRGVLYNALKDVVGEDKLNFVGSGRRGNMPDPDNEGHRGKRIDEIAGFAACAVPRYQPNVITLHAGTNDFDQVYRLKTAPQRMKSLIKQVLADSPKAVVVVAKVLPTAKPGMQPRIDAFNAELPGIVRDFRSHGKHVRLVDTSDVEVGDGLQNDSHPNDNGYAKLGNDFYEGVMDAAVEGWIEKPDPQKPDSPCHSGDGSKAGPGWRALGTIAPGMAHPSGRTDLADFDGDGRDDYVRIDEKNRTLRIALNRKGKPGKPRWKEVRTDSVDQQLDLTWAKDWELRFADLDGDGLDDIAVIPPSHADDAVRFIPNGGLTDSGREINWGGPGPVGLNFDNVPQEAVRFADVNGDGRDDYLRVGKDGSVHAYYNLPEYGSSGWRWEEHRNWAPGVFYGSRSMLRLADVNGDGKADYLMVGKRGAVHAYLNNGDKARRRFTEHRYFVKETGYPGNKVAFRDISGDGKADYVVVYGGGSVRAWLNRGGNT
ncbi:FG-GAP-like repeat-containing protein [Streptomyces sp. NPDC050161]|uniref:FG-GAP-like repeat-containing protein n=1 Tax=Streptomyces sp. NPDC050161 TaxID=3365604 RepID=UPI0037951071